MFNSFLIASFCASMSWMPSNMCSTTSEATSKQVGLYQNMEMVENYAKNTAHKYTPDAVEKTAGYGVAAYKLSRGEEAKVGFKVPDFCDRLELGKSRDSQSLMLRWNF